MRSTRIRIPIFVLTALIFAASAGCTVYSADPITAHVIDAETKHPIEGVNVVAAWELRGGLEGGNVVGYAQIMETVTDKDGTFAFPGWGPKPTTGKIRWDDPGILLFKDGYEFRFLVNETRSSAVPAPTHMSSPWNGKQIELKRLAVDGVGGKHSFELLSMRMYAVLEASSCNWRFMTRLIGAVTSPNLSAPMRTAIGGPLHDLDYLDGAFGRGCPGLKHQVQEQRK